MYAQDNAAFIMFSSWEILIVRAPVVHTTLHHKYMHKRDAFVCAPNTPSVYTLTSQRLLYMKSMPYYWSPCHQLCQWYIFTSSHNQAYSILITVSMAC